MGVTSIFAQDKKEKSDKPTTAAEAAFVKTFPGATKVKWEKEAGDYEVSFKSGKKEMSAVFTPAGALKESEEEIEATLFPAAATAYIKEHYKGAKIKETAKITKSNGEVNYEAEVNDTDLIFDKDGKFIKAETEAEKDKDKE
jgi:hypothetical protein